MADDVEQAGGSLWANALSNLREARLTRRALLVGGAGAAVWWRLGCHPEFASVNLAGWEVHVLWAAGEALLPPAPLTGLLDSLGPRVDDYLTTLPSSLRLEIHALLLAVEHGTMAGLELSRFTRLTVAQRRSYLTALESGGAYGRLIYRSLRDLVFLAYYQQDPTWAALGYEGPSVPRAVRGDAYIGLRAAAGAAPPGLVAR